jgi:hypothetical protein
VLVYVETSALTFDGLNDMMDTAMSLVRLTPIPFEAPQEAIGKECC